MSNEAKVEAVKELKEQFVRTKGAVVADYRGLTALEMVELRKDLRKESVELHVVKNTLARIAAQGTPVEGAIGYFKGPTSIALSYGEETAPAKVMVAYGKKVPKLKIKGGVIENRALSIEEVKVVADLPSKDVLLAKMLATMNAPITNFVGLLSAVIRSFVCALKEIEKKKGE